ncbi:MAG: C-terminal binding protein [Actinomycetota bacterium]|nr:C-terminal binding protein [Actinomycetota bacterium]
MLQFVAAAGIFGDLSLENDQAAGRATVRYGSLATPDDVARETADADGVIFTTHPFGADHIAALGPRVRVIGRAGIGLDAIDTEAAREAGVAVINFPDYATNEVATHAVALLLALQRRLVEADRLARAPWGDQDWLGGMAPLETLTLGLVGLGRIGRAVGERMRPLVGAVQTYDPASPALPDGVTGCASLHELLSTSDLVSLHLPLLPETARLIGPAQLATMRPGALLVNVSRGGLIDEDALAAALEEGQIGGAALDVFAHEPLAPDARILQAPNTVLSPHVAWFSTASGPKVRRDTVEAMIVWLETGTVPRGNLAARPLRSRAEAVSGGVS